MAGASMAGFFQARRCRGREGCYCSRSPWGKSIGRGPAKNGARSVLQVSGRESGPRLGSEILGSNSEHDAVGEPGTHDQAGRQTPRRFESWLHVAKNLRPRARCSDGRRRLVVAQSVSTKFNGAFGVDVRVFRSLHERPPSAWTAPLASRPTQRRGCSTRRPGNVRGLGGHGPVPSERARRSVGEAQFPRSGWTSHRERRCAREVSFRSAPSWGV